jgi:hypothetical protein
MSTDVSWRNRASRYARLAGRATRYWLGAGRDRPKREAGCSATGVVGLFHVDDSIRYPDRIAGRRTCAALYRDGRSANAVLLSPAARDDTLCATSGIRDSDAIER